MLQTIRLIIILLYGYLQGLFTSLLMQRRGGRFCEELKGLSHNGQPDHAKTALWPSHAIRAEGGELTQFIEFWSTVDQRVRDAKEPLIIPD